MRSALTRHARFVTRTSDVWLAVGVMALGIYFFSGYFSTVRFDRERIEVRVGRGEIQVQGLYHYTNASRLPAVLTLKVPFPADRDHPAPEAFSIYESDEEGRARVEILPVVRGADVRFRLTFRPREAKWIRVDYTQRTGVPNGRYLLTTTRAWRRPIERAEFVLRLPRDFELAFSNYPVGSSSEVGPWKAYFFSKTDFYPNRDWEFAWDKPRSRAAIQGGDRP